MRPARIQRALHSSRWQARLAGLFSAPSAQRRRRSFRGVEQQLARRAHNPEIAGASPAPTTHPSGYGQTGIGDPPGRPSRRGSVAQTADTRTDISLEDDPC